MRILVDENMQFARELFKLTGEVLTFSGRNLSKFLLQDVDALIVRSITNVNSELLAGTSVKFVGTATSGTDHIDNVFLKEKGITFSSAPGCNAIAVVEYVFSVLLLIAERDNFKLKDRTVGIVGVGKIGDCLNKRLNAWGVKTLLCDPPRADNGEQHNFLSLDELLFRADILTFHTPLLRYGNYNTYHLVNYSLLMQLKPNTILINTCRGSVIDNIDLLKIFQIRKDLSIVLDVWENEPNLSLELLDKVDIATAHIAGHTLEGRLRGTIQVFEDWCRFIDQPLNILMKNILPEPHLNTIKLNGMIDQSILKQLVHLVYDVNSDNVLLRKWANHPSGFDLLRKKYKERREWSSLNIICENISTASILKQLGFSIDTAKIQ